MAEELKWRKFRSKLGKDDRKKFDGMFASSRLYNSACANSARPIVLHCVIMSIILDHFKQIMALMNENKNNNLANNSY